MHRQGVAAVRSGPGGRNGEARKPSAEARDRRSFFHRGGIVEHLAAARQGDAGAAKVESVYPVSLGITSIFFFKAVLNLI